MRNSCFMPWRTRIAATLLPALLLSPVATISDPGHHSFQLRPGTAGGLLPLSEKTALEETVDDAALRAVLTGDNTIAAPAVSPTARGSASPAAGGSGDGLLGVPGHSGASGEGGLPGRTAGSDAEDAATALNRGLLGLSGHSSGLRAEGVSGRAAGSDAEAVLSRRDRDALEPGELRHSLKERLKERAVAAVNTRLTRALDSRLQGMLLALGGEQSGLRLDSSLRWDVREGVQGGLDVFVPFFGDADSTWFLQPGFLLWPGLDGERRHDLNIGGGYRRRVGDGVAGGGVFYDHNVDSTLQRLGLSLDFRSGRGYGALNVYYSLTDWEDSGEAPGQREEHALGGLDLQLHYALTDALEVHGSLGMWEHYEEGSGEHKGLRPGGSFGVDYELLPGLSFGGSYEIADALGKDRYELGLRFVWPAQSRLRAEGGVADLYSVVKREKRILYARRDTGETDCGVELRAQVRESPAGALSVGTQVEFSGRLVNAEGMSSSGLRCVGLGREFLVSNPVEVRFRDRDGDGGYEGAELQGEPFVWRVPAPGSTGSEGFEYDVGSGSYTLRFRDPSGVIPESRIRFVGGDVAGDNTYVVAVSAGVSVVPQSLTVDEGGSGVYTVQLNSRPEAEVSVTVLGATGDVTVSGSPLSFDASNWRTQQTVTVTAGGDADAEDDRVELSHRASSGDSDYAGVEVAGVTVTVRDDETAGVTLSTGSLSLSEGGSGTYTVVLATQPLETVTVTPRSDTASVSFMPATLRFGTSTGTGGWDTAQTVRVTAEQDVDAADERAQLTHAVEGYGAVTSAGRVTVTVTDDETAGVTVTPRSVTVLEGDTAGSYYTVVLSSRPSAAVTVTPRSDNTDVVFTPATLRFGTSTGTGGWDTAQTVVVTARDDEDAIADSAMLTHGIAGGDYAGVSVPSVSVTVTEDDTVGVSLSSTSLTVTEGRSETYTVVLASRPSAAVTVTPSSDNAAVTFAPSTLSFGTAVWNTVQTVTVTARQDLDTNNDSATLSHSITGGDYASVTVPNVNVTVTDDDVPGVTLSPQALTVSEGGSGMYTVVLNTQPSAAVTVTPSSDNADVSFSPATLSFGTSTGTGGWDTAQTVRVTAEQDGDAVDDSATLGHGITGGNYASVSVPAVRVTVTDDDTRGVRLSASVLTVTEGGSGNYTVVLATEPSATVTVTPSSDNADVSFSPATLSFGTGTGMGGWDTAQTVTVTAEEDLDSANDSARLTHRISGGDYASVGVSAVRVTVTDNDTPGVTLNETTLTVDEGDATGDSYTVVLNTQPSAAVTVTPSSNNADVKFTPATLSFSTSSGSGGWDTAQTVTVTAVTDADTVNDSATLTHTATSSDRSYNSVRINSVAVTVTDTTPMLTLETAPSAVAEGTAIRVTVTSDKAVSGTLAVSLTLSDRGSSGFTADDITGALTQTFTTASFSGGKTAAVTIATADDAIVEGAETYRITLGSGTGYALGSSVMVDGTLNDNDSAQVTLASTTIGVTEGQTLTVPVTMSAASDTVVNGRVTLSDGTPTADFAAAMVNFSIAASQTSGNAVFLPRTANNGDGNYNAPRSYTATVTLTSPPMGVTVGTDDTDTVTVTDNTAAPSPGVRLSATTLTVDEGDGDGGSYTVVLATQPDADVTVTVSSAAIGDVTVSGSPLTFTSGTGGNWATVQTVTVTAAVDSDTDNDSVTLTHSVSGGATGYGGGLSIDSVAVTVTDTTPGAAASLSAVAGDKQVTLTWGLPVSGGTRASWQYRATTETSGWSGASWTAVPSSNAGTTRHTVSSLTNDSAYRFQVRAVGSVGTANFGAASAEASATPRSAAVAGVTVNPQALTVSEGDSAGGTYTVVLATQPSAAVTVTPSSNNADVKFTPATLSFSTSSGSGGWNMAQTVTVTADADADADNDSATLTHGITGGDYASVDVPDVSVTVTDTTPKLTLETAPSTVAEGTAIRVTVSSDKDVTGTLAVRLTLADRGSSGFTADDITGALTQTVTTANFGGGKTAVATIATVNDAIVEGAETYRITLGSGTGYALGDDVAVDGTLNDNDSAQVTLGSTTIAVTEGQTLTVPVTMSAAADAVVNGRVTLSSGTPTADFAAAAVNFSIAASQTSGNAVFLPKTATNGDSAYNAPRSYTATVTLTSPPAGVTVGTDNTDTVTVTDNTPAPSPGVRLSATTLTVSEGDSDGGTYTVVLATQPDADVTVTVGGTLGDVTVSGSPLTFTSGTGGNWATAQTVTVTAAVDSDTDDDSVTLMHSVSGGATGYGGSLSIDSVAVTVTDTTPGAAASLSAVAGDKQVTLTWGLPVSGGTRASWQYRATTETSGWSGAPWTPVPSSNAGTMSYTVSGLTNNSAYRFQVRAVGSVGTANVGTASAEARATPRSAAVAGVTVNPQALTVSEGDSAGGTYTVVLATQPSAAVTVTPSSNNADVKFTPATLSFSTSSGSGGWNMAQTVTVTADADADADNDSATLTHGITGGDYASVSVPDVSVTVTDTTPKLTLETAPSTVAEGTAIRVTVSSDKDVTGTLAVRLTLADRGSSGFTADDITGALTQTVTTANFGGGKTAVATIATVNDAIVEGAETYRITLGSGTGYALGDDVAVDGTLNDNDSAQVTLGSTTIAVTEGQTLTVPVTMSAAADTVVNGRVTLSDGTPTADFAAAMVNFSIAANQTSGNAVFMPKTATNGDSAYNAPRSYTATVTLTSPPAGVTVGTDNTDTVTVTDNTPAPSPGVRLSATTLTVSEGDSDGGTYTVVLATQPDADVTVTVGGTLGDVTVSGSPLTFTSGTGGNWATAQSVTVTAAVDSDTDDDSVTLMHSVSGGATGYGGSLSIDSVAVTVTDTTPGAAASLSAVAGDSQVTLTWGLPVSGGTRASWQYRATTETSGWSGAPWTPVPSSNAGTMSYTVSGLTNNSAYRFQVRAVGSVGTANVGAASAEARATPVAALPELTLSGTADGTEGGSLSLSLSSDIDVGGTLAVAFSVQGSTSATDRDAAAADFNGGTLSGVTTASFNNGKTAMVSLRLTDDASVEGDEGFRISLSSGTGYTVASGSAVLSGTLTDNDGIRLTAETSKGATEGGSLSVALSAVATSDGGTTYSTDTDFGSTLSGLSWSYSGDAVAGDFVTVPSSASFSDGTASVDFVVADDSDSEESYSIQLSAVTGHTVVGSNAVSGKLGAMLTFAFGSATATVTEGDVVSLTVNVSPTPVENITVFIDTTDGTAKSPADYTPGGYSLSFGAGDSSSNLSIQSEEDTLVEGDETFTAMLTGSDYPAIARIGDPDTVTVTIEDDDTAAAGVRLSATTLTVDEGDSAGGSYTVVLATQPDADVTVTVSSAALGDVTVSGSPLTFTSGTGGNWNTAQTVTVTAAVDSDTDNDSVTLTHSVSGGATGYGGSLSIDSVAVTVTDTTPGQPTGLTATAGDAQVELSWTAPGSGGSIGSWQYRATPRRSGWTNAPWTDMSGSDSTTTRYTVESLTNNRAYRFQVRAVGSVGTANVGMAAVEASATPVAATPPGVTLSPRALTVDEGDSNGETYTVVLDTEPSAVVTVTPSSDNAEVIFSPATLRFGTGTGPGGWDTAQSVTVTARSDADADDDSAMLTHSITGGDYATVNVPNVRVTVTDTTPKLTLRTNPSAVAEGTAIRVTVSSNKDVTGTLTVSLTLADRGSSGFDANDITGALTQTVTTANFGGGKTATATIPTVDDAIVEGAERYSITLGTGTGYALGGDVTVNGTLNDNDSAQVTLASTTIAVTEGQTLTVPVTMSAAADTAVNGRVRLTGGTPTDDFAAARMDFSIAAGQTSVDASFAAQAPGTGDSRYNAPRSYTATVTLTSPPVGVTVGSDNTDTVTVTDNTAAPSPGVTLSETSLTVNEGDTTAAIYTVVLNTQPTAAVTVTVSSNNNDVRLRPTAPMTFGTNTGFRGWNRQQTVRVTARSDADTDNDSATLTHTATSTDNNYNSVTINSVAVTVTDTTPELTLATAPTTVTEGTAISLAVNSDKNVTGTLTVRLRLSDRGSSGFTADDITGGLTQNFSTSNFAGGTTATVSIATINDNIVEGAETYTITLLASTGYALGGDVAVDGTLNDDDSAQVTLASTTIAVTEGQTLTVPVTMSAAADTVVNGQVTLSSGTPTDDFAAAMVNFSIRAGETSGNAVFMPKTANNGDGNYNAERSYTATVTLTTPPAGVTVGTDNTDMVTVTDNTPAPVPGVSLSQTTLSVDEGDAAGGTYTVVLNTQPSHNVTVTVSSNNTDVSASPASLTFTSGAGGNWNTERTVTVTAEHDIDMMNDSATLTHTASSSDNDYQGVTINSVAVTVTDDDIRDPVLQLLTDPARVNEGSAIQLRVTANQAVAGSLALNLRIADRSVWQNTRSEAMPSGTDASDFTGGLTQNGVTAAFNGGTTATVSIATGSDRTNEGDDYYRITLVAGSGYTVGTDASADGVLDEPIVITGFTFRAAGTTTSSANVIHGFFIRRPDPPYFEWTGISGLNSRYTVRTGFPAIGTGDDGGYLVFYPSSQTVSDAQVPGTVQQCIAFNDATRDRLCIYGAARPVNSYHDDGSVGFGGDVALPTVGFQTRTTGLGVREVPTRYVDLTAASYTMRFRSYTGILSAAVTATRQDM